METAVRESPTNRKTRLTVMLAVLPIGARTLYYNAILQFSMEVLAYNVLREAYCKILQQLARL